MRSAQLIEKRPGHPAKSSRTESEQDTYEGASMSNKTTSTSTLTTTAEDWHPTWCAGDDSPACGPGMGEDAVHDGYPERIEFDEEYAEGTEFHAEVQPYFSPSPDPEQYREELGFTLRLAGGEVETVGYAILSTDRMRALADFLFTQADRLDAWHEQHRAARAAGHEEQHPLTSRLLEVITSEMERRSIGVDQMAEEAGVSPEEMTRKLAGQETLDMGDLYGISNVLGVKTSELIEVAVRVHERW